MAILTTGNTFSDGDQVTAASLNTATNSATFASGAVDDASTQLSGGAIVVKDSGVTTAKLNDAAVTTAKLSTGAPSWDASGNATIIGTITQGAEIIYGIKAWCVFDGQLSGTNAPLAGGGVTSVTTNADGNWTVNLSASAPSANFATFATTTTDTASAKNQSIGAVAQSTTTVEITSELSDGLGNSSVNNYSFQAIW